MDIITHLEYKEKIITLDYPVKIEFNSNDNKKYNKELLDFFIKNDTQQITLKDSIPSGMTLNEFYARNKER